MISQIGFLPSSNSNKRLGSLIGAKRNRHAIPHVEALSLLISAEATQLHSDSVRAELPAIITHWLQSPTDMPLILGSKAAKRWSDILVTFARARLRPLDSMPDLSRKAKFEIDFSALPFPPEAKPKFTFIDLFAGIGGFRIALQGLGGKCVFTSEWDRQAKKTYFQNYGEVPFGDIRQFTDESKSDRYIDRSIPDHDVIAGGFPCQPFSRAGVSARSSLGQSHGFSCEIQGTLFFDIMRIARVKRPKVLFLENVKNLKLHDGGRTFERIRSTIVDDLGYSFHSEVIDASPLVPQRRKRCYIVCFREDIKFSMPSIVGNPLPLSSILDPNPSSDFTLSDRMWQGHIKRTRRNINRGAGFTAHEADITKPANTLVARYYKDGKECLVPQLGENPRLLTPRECARLQGYPETFLVNSGKMHAYKQFGNSVALPVVQKIAAKIIGSIESGK